MPKDLKIALVNPRVESYSSVLPPLGLLYIAAVLEKDGYSVRVFDISPDEGFLELDALLIIAGAAGEQKERQTDRP